MHPFKLGIDVFQAVHRTGFNPVYQGVNLTFWSYQSGNVNPLTATDRGIGLETGTYFFISPEINAFQTLDDRVAEKLMDGGFVETDAFHQC